jgi:RNA polymerase sigma-70 factor (sigma-E family)
MNTSADAEFTDFMHGRWAQLVRLGYGLTGDQQLAEDLAQTALAKAYASWPRVRRTGNPDAYVRRIMLNANHSRFRKRRVAERLTDTMPDAGGPDPMGLRDDRSALIAALMTLPYGQRAAVVLRYWMDMTETEAAAALGCSVGNVKSQASRALAKLRLSDGLTDGISSREISSRGVSTEGISTEGISK